MAHTIERALIQLRSFRLSGVDGRPNSVRCFAIGGRPVCVILKISIRVVPDATVTGWKDKTAIKSIPTDEMASSISSQRREIIGFSSGRLTSAGKFAKIGSL